MPSREYLLAMLLGYLMTIAIETAVLVLLLSRRHPMRVRIFAGIWLSACTYPVVWLVLPELLEERWLYLLVAETFAPVAECALFWFAFIRRLPPAEDFPEASDSPDAWWFALRFSACNLHNGLRCAILRSSRWRISVRLLMAKCSTGSAASTSYSEVETVDGCCASTHGP